MIIKEIKISTTQFMMEHVSGLSAKQRQIQIIIPPLIQEDWALGVTAEDAAERLVMSACQS